MDNHGYKTWTMVAFLGAIAMSMIAAGQTQNCPNTAQDCCFAGTVPGCCDPECCEQICSMDPFCCEFRWDNICAGQANQKCLKCGGSPLPCGDGLCTLPYENGTWCPEDCPLPPFDQCGAAGPVADGATAFDILGAATDGPPHAECDQSPSCELPPVSPDIWFDYVADTTARRLVSLCGSEFDTELAVYEGCECPVSVANLLACNDDSPDCGGGGSQVIVPMVQGHCYKIRAGGWWTFDQQSTGALTISVIDEKCATDISGDGVTNVDDLLSVITTWGCSGCASDVDGDGIVSVDDLLLVINAWGPCS